MRPGLSQTMQPALDTVLLLKKGRGVGGGGGVGIDSSLPPSFFFPSFPFLFFGLPLTDQCLGSGGRGGGIRGEMWMSIIMEGSQPRRCVLPLLYA